MENKPSRWVELGIIGVLALALAFAALMLLLAGCATSPAASGEFVDPAIILSTAIVSEVRTDPTIESLIRPTQDLSTIQLPSDIYPAVIPAGISEGPDIKGARWDDFYLPTEVSGFAVWEPVYRYAQMDIHSEVLHVYHYHDLLVANACTWITNPDGTVAEVWLVRDDGYILAGYQDTWPMVIHDMPCEVAARGE